MNNAPNTKSQPLVSVGMFVYNGENFIHEAIDSIVSQSFKDFELIISDNASTDNTEKICREYANKDNRIRYIRQPVNIGAELNCKFVLDKAKSEYFMWAAHDDIRSLDFMEINVKFLQDNLDYVASISPVRFKGKLHDPVRMGDQALDQVSSEERFLAVCNTWRANGRFYSLFRREVTLGINVFGQERYMGMDNAFVLELAIKGKINRSQQGYIELGCGGASGSGNYYRLFQKNLMSCLFPLGVLCIFMWKKSKGFSLYRRVLIGKVIVEISAISFLYQIKNEIKHMLRPN